MNPIQYDNLKPGDLIKHIHSTETFIVTSNEDYAKTRRITAALTKDVANHSEWDLVKSKGLKCPICEEDCKPKKQ